MRPTYFTWSAAMSTFTQRIRLTIQAELNASAMIEREGSPPMAFWHLERAHILSQLSAREHVRVHWHMLRFAMRNRLLPEAFGQLLRLILAAPASLLGTAPTGNTGGSDAGLFQAMDVPTDLRALIRAARHPSR
jgi:hypothetical protein